MALSNWDTLAVNDEGPCRGSFVVDEVSIDIYKNWVYVYDTIAWREGMGFSKPCVMQIHEGKIQYKMMDVVVRRGPQNGAYAVVRTGWGNDQKCMVGCGVSGYAQPVWDCGHQETAGYRYPAGQDDAVCSECGGPTRDAEFVGVQPESRDFLLQVALAELGDVTDKNRKLFEAIGSGIRFNQGDAFFAEHLGAQVPGTPVGEAESTVLGKILRPVKMPPGFPFKEKE